MPSPRLLQSMSYPLHPMLSPRKSIGPAESNLHRIKSGNSVYRNSIVPQLSRFLADKSGNFEAFPGNP